MSQLNAAAALLKRLKAAEHLSSVRNILFSKLQQPAAGKASAHHWQRHFPAMRQHFRSTYHTDSRGYTHFDKPTGPASAGRWRHVLGGGALLFGAYYISSLEEVPYTHRKHAIMFVSTTLERRIGQAMFESVKEEAKEKGRLLPENHPAALLVRKVGSEVARVACEADGGGGATRHMQNMDWEYAVVASNDVNAFVVPGGKVVVFRGLLDMLSTEAELAAVLAHETAHVLARHHAERMTQQSLFGLVRLGIEVAFGIHVPAAAVLVGFFLPYSRRAEIEADVIGLRLMSRACYEPKAALSMLAKLGEHEHKHAGVPAMLRTHPMAKERVQAVREDMPKAYEEYRMAGCGLETELFTVLQDFFR